MPDKTLKQWLDNRLDNLRRDWESESAVLEKVEKNLDHFLRPALDSLGYPYTIDATTGESIVVVTPEITIIGQMGLNTYGFMANIKTVLAEKEVLICNPYISGISVFLPLLKRAIQDIQTLYAELTPQLKRNKQGELLASIIDSHLKEINAPEISIIPLCDESASCRLSYKLFSNLILTSVADFQNYTQQCRLFVNLATTNYDKSLQHLEFRKVDDKSLKRAKRGEKTVISWHGETRKIKYMGQETQFMVMPNPKTTGNSKIAKILRDCGYKYYFNDGLWVVLNDDVKIFRDKKSCFLVKQNDYFVKDKGSWHSNVDYVINEDFAVLLRIIAALPSDSITELTECHSFGNMVYGQLAKEVRKYLLPDYCSMDFGYTGGDLVIFSDQGSPMKKDLLAVYLQHDKRYISKLWSIMTNASELYNLLVNSNVEAIE